MKKSSFSLKKGAVHPCRNRLIISRGVVCAKTRTFADVPLKDNIIIEPQRLKSMSAKYEELREIFALCKKSHKVWNTKITLVM